MLSLTNRLKVITNHHYCKTKPHFNRLHPKVTSPTKQQVIRRNHDFIERKVLSPEEYEKQKSKIVRPTSPHVTIYKFPLPALTSITHRITGVALTGFFGVLAGTSLYYGPHEIPLLIDAFAASSPALLPLVKATIAFPLCYHTLFGIRHLVWDTTAKGVDLDSAYKTGQALIAASAVATVAAAML